LESEPRAPASGSHARSDDRTKGFFVGFDYSADALREIDVFFRKSGKLIVALKVREILGQELARNLA